MSIVRKRITGTLVLMAMAAVVAIPSAAAATRQLDAADEPQVSGELELQTDECRRQHESYKGETVATGKTCLRIYTYDAAAETDTERNYGVVWLQSNLNSQRGWCGAEVTSDVDLPADIQVESKAPRSMDVASKRTFETSLSPTAGGNAAETAEATTIKQTQILYKKEIRTRVLTEGNIFRLKWLGLENNKLGFASGAEISWAAAEAPGNISFRLNYELKRARC